jgi:hypothetical protein
MGGDSMERHLPQMPLKEPALFLRCLVNKV